MRKFILLSFITLLLIFMVFPVYAQKQPTHDLGKFKWSGTFFYPNGFFQSYVCASVETPVVYKSYTYYTDDTKTETETDIEERSNPGGRTVYTKEIRRWAPPLVAVNDVQISQNFYGEIDNNLTADIVTEENYDGRTGYLRKVYSFTNRNHDDYVIMDVTLRFMGDTDQVQGQDTPTQSTQVGWSNLLKPSPMRLGMERGRFAGNVMKDGVNHNNGWVTYDSYVDYMGKPLLASRPRNDLYISYHYYPEDNNRELTPPDYNVGETKVYDSMGWPDIYNNYPNRQGYLCITNYTGYTTFYADKATDDPTDDPTLPNNVSYTCVQEEWGDYWDISGGYWNAMTNPNDTPFLKSWWEEFDSEESAFPDGKGNWKVFQSYGPYDITIDSTKAAFDDVRAVYAIATGAIDEDLSYSEGKKWYNWFFDMDVPDDQKLNDEQKNAIVATGKDSLFQALDRAYWAFDRGFDVPDPPPAPDLYLNGGPGQIEIRWEYPNDNMFKDADTGGDDFYKWRVYRKYASFWVYDDEDLGRYYTYELIAELDKNTTSYIDKDIIKGADYHYCVTGVDDGSANSGGIIPGQQLEGSYYANRNTLAVASKEAGLDVSSEVIVVPNPYSLGTGLTNEMGWPAAPHDLHFVNLPKYCIIKIYTVTGDLVKTINHTDGSGDENWKNLRTDSNQYPVSGIYIAVIDEAQDGDKNDLPKQLVKFVIIR